MDLWSQDANNYIYVEFYEEPISHVGVLSDLINKDSDKLAESGATVIAITNAQVTFDSKNYLMVTIHYRATKRSTLFL